MNDNFHKGHRERLKKRFLELGIDNFQDHEILELLLYYSIPRRNTNEIAHKLIKKCRGLSNVFDADINILTEIPYITENSAILLKLIPQLLKKYSLEKHDHCAGNDIENIMNYAKKLFIGEPFEKLIAISLNDNLQIVSSRVIATGIINTVAVNIKKIIEFTYQSHSDMIILAHNHPNGIPMASSDDVNTTRYLYNILKPIGITLLDHIIVADNKAISMKDCGVFSLTD